MEKPNQNLPGSERLKSNKIIGRLFDRNFKESFVVQAFPYRAVVWQEADTSEAWPQILITVPKRSFRLAVARNRIKRLTREAYRLQKRPLRRKTYIAFLYMGKEVPTWDEVKRAIGIVLDKLR